MEKQARELNALLDVSVVGKVLSPYGRNAFFPKGIVAQSQEAADKAYFIDATAGVAKEQGRYISHSVFSQAAPQLSTDALVSYAPTAGNRSLRELWQKELARKNPDLSVATCSLPIVTGGLTHALSIAADLFVDSNDTVIIPSPCWDNYDQIFRIRRKSAVLSPSLFNHQLQFTLKEVEQALCAIESEKIVIVLNFPNNPTGFTPSEKEMFELRDLLVDKACKGTKVVVIIDDAYFGLFHDAAAYSQSLFALMQDVHENILAIKCDAATKEALVWGFRVGFITYGTRGMTEPVRLALEEKTKGAIRSSVSSCSQVSQSLLLEAMHNPAYYSEVASVQKKIAQRYAIIKDELNRRSDSSLLSPYPFNSGYFCSLYCDARAEILRKYVLKHHGIGIVSLGSHMVRIAYSAVDDYQIPEIIDVMYQSAEVVWT